MKKLMLLCLVSLVCGCAESTKSGSGLIRLNSEPTNCEFLYTIDSSVATYNLSDAYEFLETRILEEKGFGDSYYVSMEDSVKNAGAIFGPKNTYKLKAKVYKCQN